jgi:hypothetical protein
MKMKFRRKVAEKAIQYLEEEPKRFDMRTWIVPSNAANLLEADPPCGTACCFAGAIILSNRLRVRSDSGISLKAMELLGISSASSGKLFMADNWPAKFRDAYYDASTQIGRVKALRSYIESLK